MITKHSTKCQGKKYVRVKCIESRIPGLFLAEEYYATQHVKASDGYDIFDEDFNYITSAYKHRFRELPDKPRSNNVELTNSDMLKIIKEIS